MKWKTVRDTATYLAGLAGFAHEVLIEKGDRPTLLLASLALMGVPFFMKKDEGEDKK